MSSLDGDSVEMNCSSQGVICTEAQLSRYHCGGPVTFALESRQIDFSDSLSLASRTLPYLLAYKPPLCGPCETNALSQEGAYSKGGLISQISGTVLSKH
jgi:hypothetical protein